jgi:hypothetical protein
MCFVALIAHLLPGREALGALHAADDRLLPRLVHARQALQPLEHGDRRHGRRLPAPHRLVRGRGRVSALGWILFGILFFWQIPHFMAIAWTYRRDYSAVNFPMLPVRDEAGGKVARWSFVATLAPRQP